MVDSAIISNELTYEEVNDIDIMRHDFIIPHSINDFKMCYAEGDIIYSVEDKCTYYYDGKNLIKIYWQTIKNMLLYVYQIKERLT